VFDSRGKYWRMGGEGWDGGGLKGVGFAGRRTRRAGYRILVWVLRGFGVWSLERMAHWAMSGNGVDRLL